MSRISLKALSAELGLSNGTVSRALNDYPDISPATRARVKAAAEAMGYRPNSSARRLATGDAECIGYVLPWRSSHLSEPFLAELLDGLSEAMAARHWDLMLSVARSEQDELDILTRLAQSRRVNGLVISRTLCVDPRVQRLSALGLPFVTHGKTTHSDNHAWFDVDNFAAVNDSVAYLVGLGHRDIAVIAGPQHYNFAVDRLAGYRQAMADAGLAVPLSYVETSALGIDGGDIAMQRLLALRTPPTAVVCVSDMVALGAMRAIEAVGWQSGRDISVVGYDGLPIAELSAVPLTTMSQPLLDAGRRIGEMLMAVIDGEAPESQQMLVRASLQERRSSAPPPAERALPSTDIHQSQPEEVNP